MDADTHSLTVHLAGMFTPTERHIAKAERMRELGDDLFDRAQRAGAVRPDVTNLDVAFLLEMIATTSIGDEERTAEVRQRQLAVIIDGLRSPTASRCPVSRRPGRSNWPVGCDSAHRTILNRHGDAL